MKSSWFDTDRLGIVDIYTTKVRFKPRWLYFLVSTIGNMEFFITTEFGGFVSRVKLGFDSLKLQQQQTRIFGGYRHELNWGFWESIVISSSRSSNTATDLGVCGNLRVEFSTNNSSNIN